LVLFWKRTYGIVLLESFANLWGRYDNHVSNNEILDKLVGIENILSHHEGLLVGQHERLKRLEDNGSIRGDDSNDIGYGLETGNNLPPLTIPNDHNTPAIRVLRLPKIRALIGEYPRDYFYDIEIHRNLPTLGQAVVPPELNKTTCDGLLSAYYTKVHCHHPVLDYGTLLHYYNRLFNEPFSWTIETAIVLVVLALGEVASSTSALITANSKEAANLPGMMYFDPAFHIIGKDAQFDFGLNAQIAQAQVLSGIYFAYLAYPLLSWRMIHSASTTVQLMLSRASDIDSLIDDEIRLFWSSFLIESDRLAEFELPRSGIESMVDDMPLPSIADSPDTVIIHFLAEISIRRLLNRVHNTLYSSRANDRTIKSLLDICEELNRQLETWHQSTPESARPSLGMEPPPDSDSERALILRIRYYACTHIIFRPFVLRIIDSTSDDEFGIYKDKVLENAISCISAIRMYIHNVVYELARPSPYTWTLAMSTLGAILVITAASTSPHLKNYLPDIVGLQDIAIRTLSPWAEEDSSIKSVVWLMEHLKHRRQFEIR
jgi:hypothetical protein